MPEAIVIATLIVKPGALEKALSALTVAVHATHAEGGCRAYAVHQDTAAPNVVVVIERWEDLDALQTHRAQPHMLELRTKLASLLAEPPALRVLEGLAIGDSRLGTLAAS